MRDRIFLGAGVGRVVHILHPLRRQVRVNLRRAQALVAQQFLHAAEVGAVVQQMRGEAVPQRVRADSRVQAGRQKIFVELAADGAGGERIAVLVQKHAMRLRTLAARINRSKLEIALAAL